MKKLFYRFSRSRSCAKLFSLLACLALGPLFAQNAFAQFDFEFGWEPFPPSSWDGGWDPILNCEALDGTTTLTRSSTPGADSVTQAGTVLCKFTDAARTLTSNPTCSPFCVNLPGDNPDQGTIFQESATCKLNIKISNLSESCSAGPTSGTSTLTVTGICPAATIKHGEGTIDCSGGGTGGADPSFCLYAGSDPDGNTSEKCVWNLGWGAKKGQNVVTMTQNQCQTAFGSTKEVYSFTQILEGTTCAPNAQIISQGQTFDNYCHSDTWDPAQKAFCDFSGPTVKNTADATVANFLTVDTEYNPSTINVDCRPGKDQGDITLLILGSNPEKRTTNNLIAVQQIDQAHITVNGFQANSCSLSNPDTLQCRVPSCIGGVSVLAGHIDGTNGTLNMEACLGTVDAEGVCNGTRIVGDLESRRVNGL